MDTLMKNGIITDEVFAQIGYSDYKPQYYKYKNFLDRDEFNEWESKCDILITHGGTGAIIGAVKKGKKVIAVPRLARYGEHVDDHQVQLIKQFNEQNLICGLDDCSQLGEAIDDIKNHTFDSYVSNTQLIINNIEKFIDAL
jgi:UDP-N-acetylglucosamine transferase subunit ALG13